MYLRNIAISNYHTFTYHDEPTLIKGMEFNNDVHTSSVNILVGPNGSGKSIFLNLIGLLCDIHCDILPQELHHKYPLKKHMGMEHLPSTVIAQRSIGSASSDHYITNIYHLDTLSRSTIDSSGTIIDNHDYHYHLIDAYRVIVSDNRHPQTQSLIREYIGLLYNEHNQSYMSTGGSIRKRHDLGSGEQALLRIINTIITKQYQGGIVMIDEPELHLHPQYQKQLGSILEYLSKHYNIQIIIATHSSLFINEYNIENVFRFSIVDGYSFIANPLVFVGKELGKLKQILSMSNMSKLFFTDHIIMVEGETDQFFLEHYIAYYLQHQQIPQWQYNYEIITIAGKSSLHAWRMFCKQFHIGRSFIGDWDNVINSTYGAAIEPIRHTLNHRHHKYKHSKSDQYKELIKTISNHHPTLAESIHARITKQYQEHIYILRHGDLEAYLGMHDKGLEETIHRYNRQFHRRLKDIHFTHYHQDLDTILNNIFHVKSD